MEAVLATAVREAALAEAAVLATTVLVEAAVLATAVREAALVEAPPPHHCRLRRRG
jgi:hypothetical protein